jgi:hypothetical protein
MYTGIYTHTHKCIYMYTHTQRHTTHLQTGHCALSRRAVQRMWKVCRQQVVKEEGCAGSSGARHSTQTSPSPSCEGVSRPLSPLVMMMLLLLLLLIFSSLLSPLFSSRLPAPPSVAEGGGQHRVCCVGYFTHTARHAHTHTDRHTAQEVKNTTYCLITQYIGFLALPHHQNGDSIL